MYDFRSLADYDESEVLRKAPHPVSTRMDARLDQATLSTAMFFFTPRDRV
jgi:hypothetical protein